MKKYKRTVLFSGGESRYAIYGGIYAALVDSGKAPDLIIGSCGGSLSALIVSKFVEVEKIKSYMKSKEIYNFIINLKLTDERKLYKLPLYMLIKEFNRRKAPYIEDVFNKYLVDVPMELNNIFPELTKNKNKIPLMIIASKLKFDETEIKKKRNNKKLYKEVIFTDEITASMINKNILRSNLYVGSSVVEDEIDIITDIDYLKALRISITDMFYTNPILYNNEYYFGGAIDLVPLEIAKEVADEVILEIKQKYNAYEDAAVRAVFGYSGNERTKELLRKEADYWVDTTDALTKLKNYASSIKINLLKLRIDLDYPKNYEDFCEKIDKQWEYGYKKMMEALNKK